MEKKIKFGFVLPMHNTDLIMKLSIKASEVGFDSIWMADHLMGVGAPDCLDPWCTLSVLGTNEKITTRLGTSVTDPHRRHPACLAQTIATIDAFSKGKIILGIGAGEAMNLNAYGINWKKPVSKLKEFIEVIRLLWKGRPITYEGEFFNLNKAMIRPKPIQKNPPIWIAGNKPRTLKLTGELADGWIPFRLSPKLFSEDRKIIEESAKKNGRDPKKIEYSYFFYVGIGKNKEDALKKIEIPAKILLMMSPERIERLGYEIPTSEFSHSRFVPSAEKYGKIIEQIKKIPNEILEKCFAFGSADDIIDKIEEYIKIGNCRYFILCPYIMPDAKLFLDEVSEKILPHFN